MSYLSNNQTNHSSDIYNWISSKSGYKRISATPKEMGQDVAHELLNSPEITIDVAGYVYIFLSNEEATPVDVYFDDLKVTHVKSPAVQVDDYYPFGLTFNSFSRENSVKQDFKYNGKEMQDELNLGWLDYGARMHDASTGRWIVSDPLSHKMRRWSPYAYAFDNPIRFIDPEGMAPYSYNWEKERYEDEKGKEVQWSKVNQSLRGNGDIQNGMAIFVSFPDVSPNIPSNQGLAKWGEKTFGDGDGKANGAGHAGVVLINGNSGKSSYFDFGRYDRPDVKDRERGENEGSVRSSKNYRGLSVPNWDFCISDDENVGAILTKLHGSPLLAPYGRIVGALAKNLDYGKMLAYARGAEREGYLPFGGYESGYNYCNSATYCAKFARGVGAAGGFDWDWNTFSGYGNIEDVTEEYDVESFTLPKKQ
jgi:RHS repeat-associated protein